VNCSASVEGAPESWLSAATESLSELLRTVLDRRCFLLARGEKEAISEFINENDGNKVMSGESNWI
jgi:hypothetical protein